MDHSTFPALLVVGILLLGGFTAAYLVNLIGLPRITGYLVAGILLSPSVTGYFSEQDMESISLVTDIALAVIAFSIGGNLQYSRMKALGKSILTITFFQGVGALTAVTAILGLYSTVSHIVGDGSLSALLAELLILGSISVATAPAATMAVVHELRASGPLTTTLLGVVALDDALTIFIFSGAVGFAGTLLGVGETASLNPFHSVFEVLFSVGAGVLAGLLLSVALRKPKRAEINLVAMFGAIFALAGLAKILGFSPLMSNMAMGFTVINRIKHADNLFDQLGVIEESIFCLFFVLAGTHFDPVVIGASAILGFLLFGSRMVGKIAGTWVGGTFSSTDKTVKKYLGATLLPQAGLSIGLILQAEPLLPKDSYVYLFNGLLASVIINEILSPPMVKWALKRAGESRSEQDED